MPGKMFFSSKGWSQGLKEPQEVKEFPLEMILADVQQSSPVLILHFLEEGWCPPTPSGASSKPFSK